MRYLMYGAVSLLDGEQPELPLPKLVKHRALKKIKDTDIELMLKEYGIID
ncbi:hypothetical protein MGH68_04510 [Erysipelothrix sp. D19-032]